MKKVRIGAGSGYAPSKTGEALRLIREGWVKHVQRLGECDVKIYEMPNIESLQVVMYKALCGGATSNLRFYETGKAM